MRRIPLHAGNGAIRGYALVDDEDYADVASHCWFIDTHGYAARHFRADDGRRRTSLMHREVLGLAIGDRRCTDHRNGGRLDNRRSNLRIATRAENAQNRLVAGRTSPFRGVYRRGTKWAAKVGRQNLGVFATEAQAATAAAAARRAQMPFANEAREVAERAAPAARRAKLDAYGMLSARLMRATTTLYQREIADVLGVSQPRISAVT